MQTNWKHGMESHLLLPAHSGWLCRRTLLTALCLHARCLLPACPSPTAGLGQSQKNTGPFSLFPLPPPVKSPSLRLAPRLLSTLPTRDYFFFSRPSTPDAFSLSTHAPRQPPRAYWRHFSAALSPAPARLSGARSLPEARSPPTTAASHIRVPRAATPTARPPETETACLTIPLPAHFPATRPAATSPRHLTQLHSSDDSEHPAGHHVGPAG